MGPGKGSGAKAVRGSAFWDILTFEKMITGPVIHLVYWAGLGVIVIAAFSVVGASIGVALKEGSSLAVLAAIPVLIVGLLIVGALGLLWRACCEFYVTIFRIGDDLAALRKTAEAEAARPPIQRI